MTEFIFYLKQGFHHILDFDGLDHLLYVIAVSVFFQFKNWKKLLIVITAFTIGHSLTLILAGLKIVPINLYAVELLIPVTILLTCFNSIYTVYSANFNQSYKRLYSMVLIFGCIHGLGFSNFFTSMMFDQENLIKPLVAFNIGIEIGQLLIVLLFLSFIFFLNKIKNISFKKFVVVVSVIIGFFAIKIFIEKL